LKILFAEIPEEGLSVEVKDQAWFPDRDFNRKNNAYARLFFVKKGGIRVIVTGSLSVDLTFSCDRCLEEYVFPLCSEFSVDFELLKQGEGDHQEKEHYCSETEMDVLYLDEPKIEVYEMLTQQLYIAAPDKRICSEACKGLCSGCGANLNISACNCAKDIRNSPFGVLAKIKK
jgi:uncharacterized protein